MDSESAILRLAARWAFDVQGVSYDVIVVGGGGSGLAAACAAAECGGRVLVLEKQPRLGGTTGIAVGSFTAAGTALQRRAGVVDDPQAHAADAALFAPDDIEARNNRALRSFFLSQSAETFEWLERLGLSFVGPSPEPPNRAPRMHNVVPGAKAYIAAMQLKLQQLGGEIVCNAAVVELLRQDDRVTGVRAVVDGQPQEFRAERGVILAAGDYASGPDLIAQHKGERFRVVEGINPHADGDGQRLAAAAGGQLLNMDVTYGPEFRFVAPPGRSVHAMLPAGGMAGRLIGAVARRLPAWCLRAYVKRLLVTWQHPENALFDDGAILVNMAGGRFTNERLSPEREIAVAEQPGRQAYLLLDRRLTERYSAWPHFVSTAPDIAYAYVRDYERLRPDLVARADDLEELARRRGMSPAELSSAVDAFNRYAAGDAADPFGREGDREPLRPGGWILLGPVKAYFTTTEGGAAVNEQCQVLDAAGRSIPGLYAVGQNGLGGMVLWGHGLHIAWALTSGRLAGRTVMAGRG